MLVRRAAFLFLLLFVFTSTFSISLSQASLGVGALLFLVAAIRDRRTPFIRELKWLWITIAVYLGWLLVVCLVQDDPARAFDHIREEWLFLVVPVAAAQLGRDSRLERAIATLAGGLLLVSLASLIMALFGVQYHWPDGFIPVADSAERMRGNFTHALTFGNYAAVSAVLLLSWVLLRGRTHRRWLFWLALTAGILGSVATVFAGGRGPILALGLGLLGLMIFVGWRVLIWILAALIAALVLGTYVPGMQAKFTSSLSWQLKPNWPGGRVYIWLRSLDMVAEKPLMGVGPGNFADDYKGRVDPRLGERYYFTHAHNDFLQAATRSGIPGLLAFAFMWWIVLRLMGRGARLAGKDPARRGATLAAFLASLVFLASSMTEATFADEEVRALLMLVWAIGLSVWYKNGSEAAGRESASTT